MDPRRTVALVAAVGAQTDPVRTSLLSLGTSHSSARVGSWQLTTLTARNHLLTLLEFPPIEHVAEQWREALFAVDGLVIIASAEHGLDAHTAPVWHAAQEFRLPIIIAVTDLERGRVDIDEMAHIARRIFDEPDAIHVTVQPAFADDESIGGVIDVMTMNVSEYSKQTDAINERPCDVEHVSLLADSRADLIFHVASRVDDPALVEQVSSGMTPMAGALQHAALTCVRSGDLFPVLPLECTPPHIGAAALLALLIDAIPSPGDRLPVITPVPPRTSTPHEASNEADLCAQVLVQHDARALIRVWTGALTEGVSAGDLIMREGSWSTGEVLAEPPGSLTIELPAV